MEKYLKILIGIALTFLLFFGLTSVFRGILKPKDEVTEKVASMTSETREDDLIDVSEFEEDVDYSTDRSTIESAYIEDDIKKVEDASVIVSKPNSTSKKTVSTVNSNPQPKAVSKPKPSYNPAPQPQKTSYTGGRFMVLAGNYLVLKNAEHSADRLRRHGYNSEVVRFDDSRYYTVVAKRCSTRNAAVKTSNTLKRKGIDNYIHEKN